MKTKTPTTILEDLNLGEITETKKLFLLDEINALLTNRIVLRLINNTPEEKKQVFIDKINANKDNPDKILLFIDHFVDNADQIIDEEIDNCKKDLKAVIQKSA
ncbi:MAG: hypothetical protein WC819_04060 [Parcubacteria group bacterium]|jgi:hypothetical protein